MNNSLALECVWAVGVQPIPAGPLDLRSPEQISRLEADVQDSFDNFTRDPPKNGVPMLFLGRGIGNDQYTIRAVSASANVSFRGSMAPSSPSLELSNVCHQGWRSLLEL